ncbi:hypothetical protein ANN_02383 [Periplaneta americana]|uniref:Uncharacterized protein n=1 Tax=Periplaneta americana TaxID=6978 RepID=A0ABQ8TYL9_PERAM|nr:hypothetical protein ANN_02383 [Periplaneta americana]
MTKREYGKWEPSVLHKALDEFRSEAMEMNEVRNSKTDFKRHFMGKMKRGLDHPANCSVNGRNAAFLREIEEELVQHILMFEEYLFGRTIIDVRKLAFDVVLILKIIFYKWNTYLSQIRDQLATAENRTGNSDSENIQYFKFAPVTSCDVEISFFRFKSCLTNRRRSYGFENLRMHVVIHCNKMYRAEL